MQVHRLPVDGRHLLHVEEHGNPAGIPLLVLHGGPGSGGSEVLRRPVDAGRYRILCPDQRGAGRSEPAGETQHNTLDDLVADLRVIRSHLGITRWLVVGGSWGTTLALVHAVDSPDAVLGLLLRNTFLARPSDIRAFFDGAVAQGDPLWQRLAHRAAADGRSLEVFLSRFLASAPADEARDAAHAWWAWERHLTGAAVSDRPTEAALDAMVPRYRVQSHYLAHQCWLADTPLLDRCVSLPDVPMRLLHGSEDRVCPPDGTAALAWVAGTRATLQWITGAGHDPTHPDMMDAMRAALDHFARSGRFG